MRRKGERVRRGGKRRKKRKETTGGKRGWNCNQPQLQARSLTPVGAAGS